MTTENPAEPLTPDPGPEPEPGPESKGREYMVLSARLPGPDDDRDREPLKWREVGVYVAWEPHRAKQLAMEDPDNDALRKVAMHREGDETEPRGIKLRAIPRSAWVDEDDIKPTRLVQPPPVLEVG
jgi:hypothetical protein